MKMLRRTQHNPFLQPLKGRSQHHQLLIDFQFQEMASKKNQLWYREPRFISQPSTMVANYNRPDFVILQKEDVLARYFIKLNV
jgi:hypothetical protein